MVKGQSKTIAIVLLLLVGFPAASYLYLRKGINFRLDAIEALQVKSTLPLTDVDSLENGIQIVYARSSAVESQIDKIREHFDDRTDIRYRSRNDLATVAQDSLMAASRKCTSMGPADVFLINSKSEIVNCYAAGVEEEMASLIEHIAFLIPPDPEKDFEFKRTLEK